MSTAILESGETISQADSVPGKPVLPFGNLRVFNFRCFNLLEIPKCGRVNLITGKNNVGKTTFLEAVWVLSEAAHPSVICEIAMRRNGAKNKDGFAFSPNEFYSFLFRKSDGYSDDVFEISSSVFKAYGRISRLPNSSEETQLGYNWAGNEHGDWMFQYGTQIRLSSRRADPRFRLNNQFVFSNGIPPEDIYYYWGNIEYTSFEDEISNALNILMDKSFKIQRVGLRSVPNTGNPQQPYVRIAGGNEAVPLSRLGAGMQHLFNLSIAMVNAVDGILMIDEIENGIHYSVLVDVWKLVFDMAKRLNVQVFATTHSKECIEAFQKVAAQDDDPEGGMLIRLTNRNGDIVATNFDEEELEVMVRRGLEVR